VPHKPQKTEEDHLSGARERLLAAILVNVPFDGWSAQSFDVALADSGVEAGLARLACPRGALDLALAYHRAGDEEMLARMASAQLGAMRYSARVAAGVRFRLEAAEDKEIVRRGLTFFAMPAHVSDGAAAIWGTCDKIWTALGDSSRDVNWYSKRAILSGVYSSTLLFWLGDESEDHQATWAFLDRRIENVMQFEKLKGSLRNNPLVQGFMRGPGRILDRIEAPQARVRDDLPGYVRPKS
jgi:ubiquinone biosynthesis protein COQ9